MGKAGIAAAAATSLDPTVTLSDLDSIQELLAEVEAGAHRGLIEIFRGHTFVGMVCRGVTLNSVMITLWRTKCEPSIYNPQADGTWGLLQYQTKLYLVNVGKLSKELFYQQANTLVTAHRYQSNTLMTAHRY